MNAIEIKPDDVLSAERQIPPDMPIVMLNMVTYHESVQYSDTERCTGREAYLTRYAPAFNKAAAAAGVTGIEVVYLGTVAASIVPRQNRQWDEILFSSVSQLLSSQESDFPARRTRAYRRTEVHAVQCLV
jgi:hypothetical protein